MAGADQHVHYDVGVVGFGPGGQVLASVLGRGGHRVVVFEKFPKPYGLPRMSTLDGEIARLLQHTGDPALALKDAIPQLQVEMYGVDGSRIGELDWSERHSGYPSHLSMHQPNIEAAMAARIAEYPSVEVRWGRTVTDFTAADSGFALNAVSADGQPETVSARYLVGMDGASSTVREHLGIDLDVIHTHDDRWVLTDYDILKPLPNGLDHRIYMDMTIDAPYFYGPNGANRCRTDVRLSPGDDPDAILDAEQGYQFLESRVGIPREHVRQTRRVLYWFRSQIARNFRVADAFIGGDAAHAMTPYMGQGACTAMRDAIDLGWKLDLVLSGAVDAQLLDTYESERLEHDSQFVYGSLGVWTMINQDDRDAALERDEFVRTSKEPLSMYIEPLRDGVLHRHTDGSYGEQAGELAPQGRVRVGEREALLDNIVGFGFQLVSNQTLDEVLGAKRIAALDQLGAHRVVIGAGPGQFADLDGTYAGFFATYHAVALLARPDFYTFGIAENADDAVTLVDDLICQMRLIDRTVSTA